jgi:hypothetical protein
MDGNVTVCITGDIDTFEIETIEGCLKPYFEVLQKYDVKMTIPITAKAIEDYPKRAEFILKQGHEVAIHGDIHEGFYGSVEEQISRLEKAKRIFNDILGRVPRGFRAPGLLHDRNTCLALSQTGFFYDSSLCRWEVPPLSEKLPFLSTFPYDWGVLPTIKPFFQSLIILRRFVSPSSDTQAKPFYWCNQLIELPITAPDDFYLISHKKGPMYSPAQAHRISDIWLDIVRDMKQRENQLFVVEAHPRRIGLHYIEAIDLFLKVLSIDNKVEIKLLEEVAESFIAK